MRQNISIVKKFIIYFLLLNIFTVIVVGSYSYYRAKDALVDRTFDQLTSLRIEKTFRIERFFNDRISDVNLISKSEDVKNVIHLLSLMSPQQEESGETIFQEYNKFLRKHFFSNNNYKRVFIVNPKEQAICFNESAKDTIPYNYNKVRKFSIKNLWEKINQESGILIEDYEMDTQTNLPAIFIGKTVLNESENIIGTVIIEINIDAINNIMFENNLNNGLGESGESYLVGDDFLMRSTSRFHDNSEFRTIVKTEGVQKAHQGEMGTDVIKDYRNISVLSSFNKVNIPGLNWAILAEIDEKEAMVPIDSIRNNILYLSILISLFLFAFVYIIAKRISLPIIKLKHAAQNITKGNYDVYVEDIDTNDEIGSLIDAFNEMSKKIKEQTDNLKLEKSMRLSSVIDAQEIERQRLSRELHDGLGQSILAIKMRLERTTNATPEKTKKIMKEVQSLFTNTINEVRSISNNLMPAVLNEFGLVDALKNLCREVSISSGVEIEFNHDKFFTDINDKINTYLYRITQEALNNVIKHSKAEFATIVLTSNKENVYLNISDQGDGFSYAANRKLCGNGISNMKERVSLLNGSIEIISKKGKGTRIKVRIPLKNE